MRAHARFVWSASEPSCMSRFCVGRSGSRGQYPARAFLVAASVWAAGTEMKDMYHTTRKSRYHDTER
jgi:hypothetical protein